MNFWSAVAVGVRAAQPFTCSGRRHGVGIVWLATMKGDSEDE
jgi:hypothetical protein